MSLRVRVLAPTGPGAPRRPLGAGLTDLRPHVAGPFELLSQHARAVEAAALDGLVVPFDPEGLDPVVAAADVLRQTRHTTVVAELPGPFATPVYAAKLSVSLQRFHAGRLGWRVDPAVWAGDTARLSEFLHVAREVWQQRDVDLAGEHYGVRGAGFAPPLAGLAFPAVEVVGGDDPALAVGAAHADLQVLPLTTGLAGRIDAARERLRPSTAIGVDATVVAAPTRAAAELEASRTAAPSGAIVGSYDDVAARLRDLAGLGVDVVTARLTRPIEQTYRLGEHVLPRLDTKETLHG